MNTKISFLFFFLIICSRGLSQNLSTLQYDAEYKNDVWSQNKLGVIYENGEGVQKDSHTAFKWFKKAASNGYKYGYYNLGRHYEHGLSVAKNIYAAINMYEKAAALYHSTSCLKMGLYYFNGTSVVRDYNKAIKFFKDAAFVGDEQGKYYLGYCYAYGYGAEQDSTRAIVWLNKAIEDKYYFAYYMLGQMYEYGISVSKNYKEAYCKYSLGDSHNDAACTNSLAIFYYEGKYVIPDTLKAIELFEKAANNGSLHAARNLAYKYIYGTGVDTSLRTAALWFEKAAQHNDEKSIEELIHIYYELKDYTSLFKIALKGYENKFKSSMNTLAYCYAKGEGCSVDLKKAISIIDEAISLYPTDPNLYDSKGEFLWLDGAKRDAKKMWENVNKMSPNYYKENDTPLNQYITTSK